MFYRRVVKGNVKALTFKEYVHDFLLRSTINGLRHFASPKLHPLELLVWIVVMVVAIYCAAGIMITNYDRYITNPIVESIERDFRHWQFPLPAATICYIDKVDQVKADKYIKEKWRAVDSNSSEYKYYMKFIKTVLNMNYKSLSDFIQFANKTELQNINLFDLAKEVVFIGGINAIAADKDNHVEAVLSVNELGFCMSVASVIQQKLTNTSHITLRNTSMKSYTPYMCSYIKAVCHLSLTGNRAVEYTMHSTYEVPDASAKTYQAERGILSTLKATNFQIISSNEVRNLSPKRRRCLYMDEVNDYKLPVYSYNLCRMQCRRKLAIELCGCSPPFYSEFNSAGKANVCNVTGMICLSRNSKNLIKILDKNGERIDCNCLATCESLHFVVLGNNYRKMNMANANISSFMVMKITDYARTRYKKDVLFTFEDLLVSFGGTAAFFLGCSILSIVEVIYFFTLRLFWYLWKRHQAVNAPQRRGWRVIAIVPKTM